MPISTIEPDAIINKPPPTPPPTTTTVVTTPSSTSYETDVEALREARALADARAAAERARLAALAQQKLAADAAAAAAAAARAAAEQDALEAYKATTAGGNLTNYTPPPVVVKEVITPVDPYAQQVREAQFTQSQILQEKITEGLGTGSVKPEYTTNTIVAAVGSQQLNVVNAEKDLTAYVESVTTYNEAVKNNNIVIAENNKIVAENLKTYETIVKTDAWDTYDWSKYNVGTAEDPKYTTAEKAKAKYIEDMKVQMLLKDQPLQTEVTGDAAIQKYNEFFVSAANNLNILKAKLSLSQRREAGLENADKTREAVDAATAIWLQDKSSPELAALMDQGLVEIVEGTITRGKISGARQYRITTPEVLTDEASALKAAGFDTSGLKIVSGESGWSKQLYEAGKGKGDLIDGFSTYYATVLGTAVLNPVESITQYAKYLIDNKPYLPTQKIDMDNIGKYEPDLPEGALNFLYAGGVSATLLSSYIASAGVGAVIGGAASVGSSAIDKLKWMPKVRALIDASQPAVRGVAAIPIIKLGVGLGVGGTKLLIKGTPYVLGGYVAVAEADKINRMLNAGVPLNKIIANTALDIGQMIAIDKGLRLGYGYVKDAGKRAYSKLTYDELFPGEADYSFMNYPESTLVEEKIIFGKPNFKPDDLDEFGKIIDDVETQIYKTHGGGPAKQPAAFPEPETTITSSSPKAPTFSKSGEGQLKAKTFGELTVEDKINYFKRLGLTQDSAELSAKFADPNRVPLTQGLVDVATADGVTMSRAEAQALAEIEFNAGLMPRTTEAYAPFTQVVSTESHFSGLGVTGDLTAIVGKTATVTSLGLMSGLIKQGLSRIQAVEGAGVLMQGQTAASLTKNLTALDVKTVSVITPALNTDTLAQAMPSLAIKVVVNVLSNATLANVPALVQSLSPVQVEKVIQGQGQGTSPAVYQNIVQGMSTAQITSVISGQGLTEAQKVTVLETVTVGQFEDIIDIIPPDVVEPLLPYLPRKLVKVYEKRHREEQLKDSRYSVKFTYARGGSEAVIVKAQSFPSAHYSALSSRKRQEIAEETEIRRLK